ncbi:proline-rich protein 35 [Amblyraja radiata]|uniref:proline-rich protein 35 n=1 Tax=Amblyraja radiata TaxID=386614 RepID=UPI0014030910|nr:proline-rich protein 35 [Amblyraja radiata]
MSKDEVSCKISAVCRHKERKPKKPHYIPRPWGKPYNYKCFQCPFTCMEKSHLYNHMKYSLCKNSLSLLIESDWPYKKNNILNSDLRSLQGATDPGRSEKRRLELESNDDVSIAGDTSIKGADRWDACRASVELSTLEGPDKRTCSSREREKVGFGTEPKSMDHSKKTQEARCLPNADLQTPSRSKMAKLSKKAETDFIITDVFSLKDSVMKNKVLPTAGLEAKLKHYKLPRNCVSSNGILMEQWKLVTSGQRKHAADISSSCTETNIIPCYPPPAYSDYQEPQGLNLSVLGVNYPMNHSLFSYLSPAINPNGTTPAQVAQLPFLSSSAQLVHPQSGHLQPAHLPGRSPVPPRFFYPLLFEQTLSTAENRSTTSHNDQDLTNPAAPNILASRALDIPNKAYLRKVPILRPHVSKPSVQADGGSADANYKSFLTRAPDQKYPAPAGENPAVTHKNAFVYNSPTCKNSRDTEDRFIKTTIGNNQETSLTVSPRTSETSASLEESKENPSPSTLLSVPLSSENSKQPDNSEPPCIESISSSYQKMPPQWTTELEETTKENPRRSPEFRKLSPTATSPVSNNLCKSGKASNCLQTGKEKNGSVVLINDLCKVIHEYQDVEEKLCFVVDEDTPGQKQLRGQLTKIRKELYHIRQVLEKTSKQHEGPLDLSVKKSQDGVARNRKNSECPEETFENCGTRDSSLGRAEQSAGKRAESAVSKAKAAQNCYANADNKSLDLCVKVHEFERLGTSPEMDTVATHRADLVRASGPQLPKSISTETTFTNRATKCEADSSVPLSAEGKFISHLLPVAEESCSKGEALKRAPSGDDQKGGVKVVCTHPFSGR